MHLLLLLALADARLVAVLEFKNKVGGAVDAGYLADSVRTAALDSGARVMTRENMLVLLKSTGRKLEECEGECEVDTGRRLGADLVVSGEVLKFGSRYKLDLRMHDTQSGQLVSGAQASGKSLDDLDDAIPAAVKKLFAPLAARTPPEIPPPQKPATFSEEKGGELADTPDLSMIAEGVGEVKVAVRECGRRLGRTGMIMLTFRVAPDGRVHGVSADAKSDPRVRACASAAMEKATFPTTRRGGDFSYPFVF